jgi:hypothetical protein
MSLLSFSDSKHVPLILDGRKAQTTRTPRKNPIKEGDTLHVYFRPRMKKTCENCITDCYASVLHGEPIKVKDGCYSHSNYFGTAIAIKVEEFDPLLLSPDALEAWAKADGFESWEEANTWFTKVHGPDWIYKHWDIIYFEGDWIK